MNALFEFCGSDITTRPDFFATLLSFKTDPNLCDSAYRCAFEFFSSKFRDNPCNLTQLSKKSEVKTPSVVSSSVEEECGDKLNNTAVKIEDQERVDSVVACFRFAMTDLVATTTRLLSLLRSRCGH